MSNIYIQEPPSSGKVLLKTTIGDIDIELWSRETPRACRNFIQLCLEGYFNGTVFHRVVKGFIAQGGDPEGTGLGGESIYGEPFKNEIHTRLRFCRRGLVALANSGNEDNGSQFFFTLAATPELQNKHTIFGKVAGDTIYNMIKFDDIDTDSNDRPIYPPKILKTEVLHNPFEDIIPRTKIKKSESKSKKKKAQGVKNFKLLSFGSEAEDDEEDLASTAFEKKSKSVHDLLEDPKLSAEPALKRLKGTNDLIENEITEENEYISGDEGYKEPTKSSVTEISKNKSIISDLIEERSKYEVLKKNSTSKGTTREAFTLQLLNKFRNKIDTLNKQTEEKSTSDGWMVHEFKCVDKEVKLAKDANSKNSSWFDITDPRNEINVRKREDSSNALKKKK